MTKMDKEYIEKEYEQALHHVSESPGQLYPGLLSSLKREI